MLYSEIKRETLGHINQYSMAGTPVSMSYNNQADYLLRIPVLINEGLVNIRTLVKPAPEVFTLVSGEDYGDMIRYNLPDDFWSLKTGGVSMVRDDKFQKTNEYRLHGKKSILIPQSLKGSVTIEYYRYPNLLPINKTPDDFDLDEDIEVIQTATYYAAANLVLLEDEFAYSSLYNDYESRLGRIGRGIAAEVQQTQDSYLFNMGGY